MFARTRCVPQFLRPSFAALIVLAAIAAPGGASAADVINENFEGQSRGSVSEARMKSMIPQTLWAQSPAFGSRVYLSGIVNPDRSGGSRSLKVTYPEGDAGSRLSGAQAKIGFNGASYTGLTAEYDFMFAPGFDYTEGGKMPGLASNHRASGGNEANQANGFTARYMWRSGRRLVLYLYAIDQTAVDVPLIWSGSGNPVTVTTGRWHNLKQRIWMNQPGRANGGIKVWFDGHVVLNRDDIEWRENWNTRIDNLYFSTFSGGSDGNPLFKPARDSYLHFDNIRVYQ